MTAASLWRHRTGVLDCSRGRLVGIVNANPDSFSDAGRYPGTAGAVEHGLRLEAEGADVVEVGGESLSFTEPTPAEREIDLVVPVIERLAAELRAPVAVDTFKAPVARAAIAAGASIVNDPTGLRDPAMARAVAEGGAGVVLTHFFGEPKVRPDRFPEVDVPAAVAEWARAGIAAAGEAGIPAERIVVDPGVGLGKSPAQDLDLLHRIGELTALGRPILVPISNKKVLGALTGRAPADRLAGTAAAMLWCRLRGATVFRVHEVGFLADALRVVEALAAGRSERWFEVPK